MKDSKDSKKSLLGDLEKIQKLLNSETPAKGENQAGAQDIPLLSDVVSGQNDAKADDQNTTTKTDKEDKPKNSNPFIPYEAIDRLNKERSSMRNFAAEVMQAAQQGIEKPPIDSFDLFQYSKNTPKPEVSATAQPEVRPETPPPSQPKPPKAVIKQPSDAEIQSLVDEVIDEYRPVMEKALRASLTEFIKQSLNNDASD